MGTSSTVRFAACVLLTGCASQQIELHGEDDSTFFAGLHGTWTPDSTTLPDGRPPPTELMLEIDVSASSSDFSQQVPDGSVIELGPVLFDGPTEVQAGFDLTVYTLDGRLRARAESGVGLDLFLGLGYSVLELEASDPANSVSSERDGLGPYLGAGVFWELPARLRIFAEVALLYPLVSDFDDAAELQTLDVGIGWRLVEAVELIGGWRRVDYEDEVGFDSDFDLQASGPRLTLAVHL
jgi:hypothetical protein